MAPYLKYRTEPSIIDVALHKRQCALLDVIHRKGFLLQRGFHIPDLQTLCPEFLIELLILSSDQREILTVRAERVSADVRLCGGHNEATSRTSGQYVTSSITRNKRHDVNE